MNRIKKTNLLIALFSIIILLALPTLLVNRGFYYAETDNAIKINLETETENILDEAIDAIKGTVNNISRIDRNNQEVFIEHISRAEVEAQIAPVSLDLPSYTLFDVSQELPLQAVTISISIIVLGILLVSFILGIFFSARKNVEKTEPREFIGLLVTFFAIGISGALVQMTVLSVISRLYRLRIEDIFTITIPVIISAAIFLITMISYRNVLKLNATDIVNAVKAKSRLLVEKTTVVSLLLITPLFFAVTTGFVIPATLLMLGVVIGVLSPIFIVDGLSIVQAGIRMRNGDIDTNTEATAGTKAKKSNSTPKAKKDTKQSWQRGKKKRG